jgi:hypothetical protein
MTLSGRHDGTTLAPIAVDYIMRVAFADQSLGLKITFKVGTTSRINTAKYVTDLLHHGSQSRLEDQHGEDRVYDGRKCIGRLP